MPMPHYYLTTWLSRNGFLFSEDLFNGFIYWTSSGLSLVGEAMLQCAVGAEFVDHSADEEQATLSSLL